MKGCMKIPSVFLLLSLCLLCYGEAKSSMPASEGSGQSLELGASYLHLRKSFLDFPIVWTSTMPVVSARYEATTGRFHHRVGLDYARSTYININGSRRWGHDSFSILGFGYDLIWCKLPVEERHRLGWGLGVSLENREITQRTEMAPGQYSKQTDHYFGVGPDAEFLWKLDQGKLRFRLSSLVSVPRASFGILQSDAGFTERSYLWWFNLRTDASYRNRILAGCDLLIRLSREVLVYGRTWRTTPDIDMFYSGGSMVFRSLEVSLNYSF